MPRKIRLRPKSSLVIPQWADKAIGDLSKRSGVTAQKVLENALRDGIQTVGEPLRAWINYQQSAIDQFNEYLAGPKAHNGTEPPIREEAPGTPGDYDLDSESSGAPADLDGLDPFDERSGLPREVPSDTETIQTLVGD